MKEDGESSADKTAAVMNRTAESLEQVEGRLHRTAERSPNRVVTERVHRLADAVTSEAKRIAGRAADLADQAPIMPLAPRRTRANGQREPGGRTEEDTAHRPEASR